MKKLSILFALVVAVVIAPAATAGCWATVGVSPLPSPDLRAGERWAVTIRVLQHGVTPLAGAKPEVRISSAEGVEKAFRARPLVRRGSYRATVIFPTSGHWRYVVYDGFVPRCASEHPFAAVTIAPA